MIKTISMRIAAIVAAIFSLLTIVEGVRVLLGVSQPEYLVLRSLLIYNVIMGVAGFIVGILIWSYHRRALMFATIVAAMHLAVLLGIEVLFYSSGSVAMDSVKAMIVRSAIWLAVVWAVWKANKS